MVYALAENIRSLYNVGSIFRTADGAGVSRVFLTGITGCPPNKEIRKVALGAEENVPWEYHPESVELVKKLKKENVKIVVLETTDSSVLYDQASYQFPLCLVMGNEYHGVSDDVIAEADLIVTIPMKGTKISLNVAVAFGITIYEITKAYKKYCEEK